jgi:hypothetical protein
MFAWTGPASAQTRLPSSPRIELAVSSGIVTGTDLDDANADLRNRSGDPLRLFTTSSEVSSSIPIEVRLGYGLTRRSSIEIRGGFARPELRTAISGDLEDAPGLTVVERVDQYTLDGSFVFTLREPRPGALIPFVSAGAGYGWLVHEGLTLLEHGLSYRGGAGLKVPLTAVRQKGWVRGVGIRADSALVVSTGGLSLGSDPSWNIAATGGVYFLF